MGVHVMTGCSSHCGCYHKREIIDEKAMKKLIEEDEAMTKKKVEEKLKAVGTLTVEKDNRMDEITPEEEAAFLAAEAEFDEKVQEAEKELVEIMKDEVQIYQKAMKGKHIAELFSGEE